VSADGGARPGGAVDERMSKRLLQVAGAMLLVLTVGIVSCQALFSGTSGLPTPTTERGIR